MLDVRLSVLRDVWWSFVANYNAREAGCSVDCREAVEVLKRSTLIICTMQIDKINCPNNIIFYVNLFIMIMMQITWEWWPKSWQLQSFSCMSVVWNVIAMSCFFEPYVLCALCFECWLWRTFWEEYQSIRHHLLKISTHDLAKKIQNQNDNDYINFITAKAWLAAVVSRRRVAFWKALIELNRFVA